MSDHDILSSLTWPGAFDPPVQENEPPDLEMGMEQLEINSSPENLGNIEAMTDPIAPGNGPSQPHDPYSLSADEVVTGIRSHLAEIAKHKARIEEIRQSFQDYIGVACPTSASQSKRITIQAKVQMDFDEDERIATIARLLNVCYEGDGVVSNVQLVNEREVYDTWSESQEGEDEDEISDDEEEEGEGEEEGESDSTRYTGFVR